MKHYETLEHSFDATISALKAGTSALNAETSAVGAATSAIARSYRRYQCGDSGDIGDCGVGITPQMCNRVTNHGDVSTFSKPAYSKILNANNEFYCLCKNIYLPEVSISSFLDSM